MELWDAPKFSGKSFLLMKLIEQDLVRQNRLPAEHQLPIETNVDIRWQRFAKLMWSRHKVVIEGKLFVRPSRGEAGRQFAQQFWTYRGRDKMVVQRIRSPEGYEVFEAAGVVKRGCIYRIDEVQKCFRAREFAKFSPEADWYLSVESQLGDDVVVATQHAGLVDVTFSRQTNVYCEIVNTGTRGKWGMRWFRWFIRRSYAEMPEGQTRPLLIRTQNFLFDKELADCYFTDSASGRKGTGARQGDWRYMSRPTFAWVLVPACIVGVLWMTAPTWLGKMMPWTRRFMRGGAAAGVAPVSVSVPPRSVGLAGSPAGVGPWSRAGLEHQAGSVVRQAARASGPVLYGFMQLSAGLFECRTSAGRLVVGAQLQGDDLYVLDGSSKGRWRLGRRPEGFFVPLPEGWTE